MAEWYEADAIHVVGSTAVDAMHQTLASKRPGKAMELTQQWVAGRRLVFVSTGGGGEDGGSFFRALIEFIEHQPELCMIFSLPSQPEARAAAFAELDCHPRIRLMEALDYCDTMHLLSGAWLVVSDSGDCQEEAAALGVPMIVGQKSAFCAEAVECGRARLVGNKAEKMGEMLLATLVDDEWHASVERARDAFGDGHAARRICDQLLGSRSSRFPSQPLRLAA
jgi:UDP-N-acetylglucosamine 2-epimerase (non-hydrolysing)